MWDGYKVHFTETCEPDGPNLITNVTTMLPTAQDRSMAETIHPQLAARDCLPAEHWVDAGCPTSPALVRARHENGIALLGPIQADNSADQRRGWLRSGRTIDWDNQQATSPGGHASTTWSERLSQRASRCCGWCSR